MSWSPHHENYVDDEVKRLFDADSRTEGVYVIWAESDDTWEAIYVGQGILRERLLAHIPNPNSDNRCITRRFNKVEEKRFQFMILDAKDLSGAEQFLYNHFNPECNEKDPGGTPEEVEIPRPPFTSRYVP